MCAAYIESQNMFTMATSLSCRVSAISAFCWPTTTQIPSISNSLVAIVHIKSVIGILVPKLVAMAPSLRTSKSAMSSSDSLNPKISCRQLSQNRSYSPSKAKKWLLWQRPLGARHRQYLRFILNPLHNKLRRCYRSHKTSYSNFSPQIGCHCNVPQRLWTPI